MCYQRRSSCLAQPVQQLATQIVGLSTGSRGKASTINLTTSPQNRPPTRKAEPDSDEWDIQAYAESISGGKRTWLPLEEMPSMPRSAQTSRALESHGRISVDSRESSADDVQTAQLWHDIKRERLAKEEEATKAGRGIRREITARCCKCKRPTRFLYCTCIEVGCGHLKCSTCF